ncbi:unnamed protein product [Notodromas monacha]|uniref:Transmembrane protein 45A n=1 Tax=Notodromas monacha TaxID=399045 RepID=A0A7R9BSV3_9CRUS|nr:unnamed protein product [Notodromas monacha]CAG0921112.1 unnamed protein product [Notodromas monacha]
MGTLMGHVLPGSFFIAASLWWLWVLLHKYFKSKLPKGKTSTHYEFRSSLSVAGPFIGNRLPMQGILLITLVTIGIIGEAYTGFRNGKFVVQGNGQHITMYFFFGMVALTEVLNFYRIPLPRDLDYATFLLALLIEAMLFYHHLHGRTMLDVQRVSGHVANSTSWLPCTTDETRLAATGSRSPTPSSVILPRTWGAAQGQFGAKLRSTTIFAMHIAGVMIFTFILGVVVNIRVKRLSQYTPTYELNMPTNFAGNSSHFTINDSTYSPLSLSRDEDEEEDDTSRHIAVA